jgi:Na+/proline symporter
MWTDAFQMIIVIAGVVAVVWKGTTEMGGFDVVWQLAQNGSKLQADK